ncbi:MAG: LuxR C-terminal-related transcriptional regulator, partial [Pseudomonas helleri]
ILLTGHSYKQDVIKALRIGIADYYPKPVDLAELLEGIQRQEAVLRERQKNEHLGHLNQKLQYLAESIDDLYQDMETVRHPPPFKSTVAADDEALCDLPPIFKQLSPRQLDVAKLEGKGQTNYQIACDLGITENTVKLYVSQVLRLTHMNNRTQLALALSPSASAQQHRQTAH